MDNNELNNLEALAKAATPGPWAVMGDRIAPAAHADRKIGGSTNRADDRRDYAHEICMVRGKYQPDAKNAAYIAAANPAAILELIALARRSLPVDTAGIKTWRERLLPGYEECDEREARDAEVAELRAALARAGSAAPTGQQAEPVGPDARDAERFRWIENNCRTTGGGHGFTLTCYVPVDEEDIGCAIDAVIAGDCAAMSAAQAQPKDTTDTRRDV